jgi:tetratricopeptide (TPR) repeat protein
MNVFTKTWLLAVILGLFSCGNKSGEKISSEDLLKLANAYYTNGLYEAAVNSYLQYLSEYSPDKSRAANTYYTVADIYFERVKDYDKALEYYFKIKYLYPESKLQGEVSKKIVASLERLNRTNDAVRIYEKEAALEPDSVHSHRSGEVLAESGTHKVTQGDLDYEISNMPPYMREQFKSPEKKKELVQQMIIQDLLYDSAKRKGLDKDKEVIEGVFKAKKGLMVQKLIADEIKDQVKIDKDDVQLYYLAHKDKYTEKDKEGKVKRQKSFEEVARQVSEDLLNERQMQAYQKMIDKLARAQNVKIYNNRIK